MKKLLYIIIALSLLGCNQPKEAKSLLLNLSASGEIELVPDMAGITVRVGCTNKNLSVSNDCARKRIDDLFDLLSEHKIPKEDYHSSRINLEKEYIWKKNSQVFHGYKSSSTISILFKNLDIMSAVISKVMTMKNAEVYNLYYSHSELEAYSNKAYLKALDNAGALAEEMKNKLKGKSIKVSMISNVSGNFDTPESGMLRKKEFESLRSGGDAPIQINPGALKVIKNIYAQYIIRF